MKYRREIDGLRAVAILPVILFHAGFGVFSGGFVGVDVFFVISGYLITLLIFSEIQAKNFSIMTFYERRARRILPALFFVMAVCIPFSWFMLPPEDMKDFSQSVIAVATFSSNILFWQESGYFATTAELKPLLHTWSLAVEEQYYIVFPVLLMLLWRTGKKNIIILLLSIIMLASLAMAEWRVTHDPTEAFYLLHTRFWELLLGSIVSLCLPSEKVRGFNRLGCQAASLIGISLILYSIFVFDKSTPFPSIYALIPTIGAALIIAFATPSTWVGRILSTPAFVGVGLISYSLYLWHQPLLVFARFKYATELDKGVAFAILGLACFLACLSWRFVEQPFRRKNFIQQKKVFLFSILTALLFIFWGTSGHVTDGYKMRKSAISHMVESWKRDKNPDSERCLSTAKNYIRPSDACSLGSGELKVALLGDSHADAIAYALGNKLKEKGMFASEVTYTGCPPAEGLYRVNEGLEHKCDAYNKDVNHYLKAQGNIEYVILLSRWTLYVEGTGFDNQEGGKDDDYFLAADVIIDGQRVRTEEGERKAKVLLKYKDSIEKYLLTGKKVILIYPVPEAGWKVHRVLSKNFMNEVSRSEMSLSTRYDLYKKRNAEVIAAFDAIQHPNLIKIKPQDLFCDTFIKDRCAVAFKDKVFYSDGNHLSNTGAELLVTEIIKAISP